MNNFDISNIHYKPLECSDLPAFARLYGQRSNLCCESGVLDGFMWRRAGHTTWTNINDECLLMIESIDECSYAGSLPFCPQDRLCDYFLMQQRYFNEVLHLPLKILYADEAGKCILEKAGLLDGYDVTERTNLTDYLYDAESLRTLAGRKLSKKRNHIHKFEAEYGGRWEYVRLGIEDKDEVLALFDEWADAKAKAQELSAVNDAQAAYPEYDDPEGEEYCNMEYNRYDRYDNVELELEHDVLIDLFSNPEYLGMVKAGGIRIDGRLRAFSVGCLNAFDNMAVINIEKAVADINGLYPVLSREFLIHEFPNVLLVNREDDAGDPGLRQSKLSYYPSGYARKYLIQQQGVTDTATDTGK